MNSRVVTKNQSEKYDEFAGKDALKMNLAISDTHPTIYKMLIAGYSEMSPKEKLRRVDELTKAVQQLALSRIQKQYGNISEREQQLRLASLWLDRETMMRVFKWDPRKEGY